MIIDCHVHLPSPGLGQVAEWAPHTPDLEAALAHLRRCGVERIVAGSIRATGAKTPEEVAAGNDEALAMARAHPDFIVPAGCVNTDLGESALAELRRCRDAGVVWVGELCAYIAGFSYDTEDFARAMRLAAELDMVVQIHATEEETDRLCAAHPGVTFVLAHLGDSRAICLARCDLAAEHPNLYLDICGNGYERMGILEYAVRCAGPDRVLFGSDFTVNDPASVIGRVEHSILDAETQAKLLGSNSARLLAARGVCV